MATILLVDDSRTIRDIVKIYLTNGGHTFIEAEDGMRALSLVGLTNVDLVIADVMMPRMDGIAFTKKLRADTRPEKRSIPVVLLTGEGSAQLQAEGQAAGANAFVKKPVGIAELTKVINQALGIKAPDAAKP